MRAWLTFVALVVVGTGCRALLGIEDAEVVDARPVEPDPCQGEPGCSCVAHGDCDSQVCLANGSCADHEHVAYLAPGGDPDGGCTQPAPCGQLEDARITGRPIIKLVGQISAVTVELKRAVEIYGDSGATLVGGGGMTPAPMIVLATGGSVSLFGMRLTQGRGMGIELVEPASSLVVRDCVIDGFGGRGISAVAGGTIVIDRTVIARNDGTGLHVDGAVSLAVTNTIITQNGLASSVVGGAYLYAMPDAVIEHVTISDNTGDPSDPAGRVRCRPGTSLRNSIVTGNPSTGCTITSSLLDVSSAGNYAGDPRFADTDDPAGDRYYRIGPESEAVDRADASSQPVDIDNLPRPNGERSDLGADEAGN